MKIPWPLFTGTLLLLLVGCSGGSGGEDGGDAGVDADGGMDAGGDLGDGLDAGGDDGGDASLDGGEGDGLDGGDGGGQDGGVLQDIPLQSAITRVQPMTGLVLWTDHQDRATDAIQLEYSYMPFDQVAVTADPAAWDWSGVEALLDAIAARGHQAVLRFYYVYPGQPTTVPRYIKDLADYDEISGTSEGEPTDYPDWSNAELMAFTLRFYTELAARYDDDPRLAFLQVGFGLWGEYHLYDPGEELGVNFPSMDFQAGFFRHLETVFDILRWSVSIDSADDSNTPLASQPDLLAIGFGLFDDSFLHADHDDYNAECFAFFGPQKRLDAPVGGELSYYTQWDQEHALDLPDGPHGVSFEQAATQYNVTYMIGNDQPEYQSLARIEQAGLACGYAFEVTAFAANPSHSRVTVHNAGIAPIYYDAFVSVNGVRATGSLADLMPGESREYEIPAGGQDPQLRIECDRLVPGQEIQFSADL